MLNLEGKYGGVNVDGLCIEIDKIKTSDFDKYIEKLETKRAQHITQQNDYLSQIVGLYKENGYE